MSRIIKMGVAAAMECLKDTGLQQPDAIITGTAYGCLADTDAFLTRLVEFKEELLSPTAFIQSTHNTVAGQIALLLQCHHHNNTFVHRGFSFESALLDAITMIKEGEIGNALVGGVDEIIASSHAILQRFGLYRDAESLSLISKPGKGTMAGEGASFFLLSSEQTAGAYAKLDAITTFYKPASVTGEIKNFLEEQHVNPDDIDLILTGRNGNRKDDAVYDEIETGLFAGKTATHFKHLCGEYPTATAFGLWLAANIIRTGRVPGQPSANTPKKILLYNHYQHTHHSLYLLSAC